MKNKNLGTMESRDSFSNRLGFILACVGSAVGMGNIWLFPFRVGQFGGFAFLIPYFTCVLLLGLTGVIGEMSFGRAMRTGPLGAFKKALQRRGKEYGDIIGLIPVIGSLGIAIGYAVVVGWILRFLFGSITGAVINSPDSGAYFGQIAGPLGSLPWHLLAIILTLIVMNKGISAGIEKINKFMMPAFFLLFLILAIRVSFLPGAMAGYKFLFNPDWSKIMNPQTWVFAMGQAFFSLSIAGSGTIVYGSYLKDSENVVSSSIYIGLFDTLAATLAALVILPSVFAFGMDPGAGPPLMFITMPEIFKQMQGGYVISIIFFIAVTFAGITSLVNLFETPIEALQNRFNFSRSKAVSSILIIATLIGLYVENGDILGTWMDVMSIYVIPLGAMLAGIMFFWVCGKEFAYEKVQMGREKTLGSWFIPAGRYIFCGITIFVYIAGIFYGGIG